MLNYKLSMGRVSFKMTAPTDNSGFLNLVDWNTIETLIVFCNSEKEAFGLVAFVWLTISNEGFLLYHALLSHNTLIVQRITGSLDLQHCYIVPNFACFDHRKRTGPSQNSWYVSPLRWPAVFYHPYRRDRTMDNPPSSIAISPRSYFL